MGAFTAFVLGIFMGASLGLIFFSLLAMSSKRPTCPPELRQACEEGRVVVFSQRPTFNEAGDYSCDINQKDGSKATVTFHQSHQTH